MLGSFVGGRSEPAALKVLVRSDGRALAVGHGDHDGRCRVPKRGQVSYHHLNDLNGIEGGSSTPDLHLVNCLWVGSLDCKLFEPSRGFPLNVQEVELLAGGSTTTKFIVAHSLFCGEAWQNGAGPGTPTALP